MTLEERVAALEDVVAAMAGEVRTRRVVVVEADGFERVVAEGCGDWGGVSVNVRNGETHPRTQARMTASEEFGSAGGAMVYVVGDGNVNAVMESDAEGDASVWVAAPGVDSRRSMILDSSGVRMHSGRVADEQERRSHA